MSETLATYSVQIIGPAGGRIVRSRRRELILATGTRHVDVIFALEEAEENLTDLLPDGYRAEIKEWDE